MTVTEAEAAPSTALLADVPEPTVSGFAAVLGSGDHKVIGRLWMVTSLLFLLVSGATGMLVGLERIDLSSASNILGTDVAGQVASLSPIAGVFLFLLPLLIGLGTYLVPLQIGAQTIAFPRAAAGAFWANLIGSAVVIASFLANGGPYGGEPKAVDLFLAALIVVLAAQCLAWVCIVTSALALRTNGMRLTRLPLFAWSNLVGGVIWLLTLPVLAGVLALVYVDHRYGRVFLDGNFGVYPRIVWVFGVPAVYALAIPVLGIIGEIVPVAARTRFTQHRVAQGLIGAFAALSIGGWAQFAFTPTNDDPFRVVYRDEIPYLVFAFAIGIPALGFLGLVADTIRRGAIRVSAPLVFAIGSLLALLLAVANGALASIYFVDALEDLAGSSADASQRHLVFLSVLLGAFGALTYWAPKVFGRRLPDGPATGVALLLLLGTFVATVPDLLSGLLFDVADGKDTNSIEAFNLVAAVGGGLVLLGVLGFLGLLLPALAGAADAEDDPWEGHTLEWATSSPPPPGNFATIPEITSEAPVYDARHAAAGS